jgi:hypothetical protein
MTQIGEAIENEAVTARKGFLIKQLNKLGIYQLSDGRKVDENLSLYTLEWSHVEEKNKVAKAYLE